MSSRIRYEYSQSWNAALCSLPTTWEAAAAAVIQKWAEKKVLLSENVIKIILEWLFGALGSLEEGLTRFHENLKFDQNCTSFACSWKLLCIPTDFAITGHIL